MLSIAAWTPNVHYSLLSYAISERLNHCPTYLAPLAPNHGRPNPSCFPHHLRMPFGETISKGTEPSSIEALIRHRKDSMAATGFSARVLFQLRDGCDMHRGGILTGPDYRPWMTRRRAYLQERYRAEEVSLAESVWDTDSMSFHLRPKTSITQCALRWCFWHNETHSSGSRVRKYFSFSVRS